MKGAGKTTADLVISQHHAREREGVSSLRGLLVETESEGGGGRKRKADKICDSCVHKLHGYDDFILVSFGCFLVYQICSNPSVSTYFQNQKPLLSHAYALQYLSLVYCNQEAMPVS